MKIKEKKKPSRKILIRKKTKKLGKVQLRILYKLYLPENMGGINRSPSSVINNYGGNAVYPALKSLKKQGYINSGYYKGAKGKIWGKVYHITHEGQNTFKENMKNKSHIEIREKLYHKKYIKNPKIFWK